MSNAASKQEKNKGLRVYVDKARRDIAEIAKKLQAQAEAPLREGYDPSNVTTTTIDETMAAVAALANVVSNVLTPTINGVHYVHAMEEIARSSE